ncbi:MAG: signal peptide peptidase SppA [Candidatus Aminicenantes bacterium]|nr:signal peptide peptidase SppA [Candidatus Aminicenantes bacterium]
MNFFKAVVCFMTALAFLISSACSPHVHLDIFGTEQIKEVVLEPSESKDKILVLNLEGFIGASFSPGLLKKEQSQISQVYYRLELASQDPHMKGVILCLDTPGGGVTATDILYREIFEFKKKTGLPVVALMMGVAASGGYYVASACDFILAHPSSITGSIGVISIFPNFHELMDQLGIQVNVIKSGKMKDAGSTFKELSPAEKDIFQEIVDDLHQKFLDAVYRSRKEVLSREELKELADGRIYTASQALELKLIDDIGYFHNAKDLIYQIARIEEAQVVAYTYYPQKTTNIYSMESSEKNLFKENSYLKLFQSLPSGFYYLWLPHMD